MKGERESGVLNIPYTDLRSDCVLCITSARLQHCLVSSVSKAIRDA